jgi:chromosomal replication initiator protein
VSRATFIHGLILGKRLVKRSGTASPISRIILQTASERDLSASQLTGKQRTARIAQARHEAVLRAHETGRYSLSQIGRAFGGRDHTTILNSIKRGKELRARND